MIRPTQARSLVTRLQGWLLRRPFERILLVGATPLAKRLIELLDAHPRCAVLGLIDDNEETLTPLLRRHRLGASQDLQRIMELVRADRIVIALTERRRRLPVHGLLELHIKGIPVEDGTELYERLTEKVAIESLTPSHLLFSRTLRTSSFHELFSRSLSVLVAATGLVLLAPVFLLIAIAIKLDSHGPVFFVQERAGLGGRPFRLIKFQTMHPTDEPVSEWAKDNGHRITRVGRWLRKFRLDELPQFVNILRGEMNLVGPRPHPVSNVELFALVARNTPECGEPIPYYSLRCTVRPGITGWAQVRYRYANDLEEEIEKLRYDLYYIAHKSIWLDLRILLETARIVLLGRGTDAPGVTRSDKCTTSSKRLVALDRSRIGRSLRPSGQTIPQSTCLDPSLSDQGDTRRIFS